MTAAAANTTTGAWEDDSRVQRFLAGPSEGWLTLAGVALMIIAIAWSIDDVRYIRGIDSHTDFLATVGLIGVAIGFAGPKLGWGRWTTHLLGICFAAIVLPIIAGGMILGDAVEGWSPVALAVRYREAARIVYQVYYDLGVLGRPLTNEYGHYFIAIGGLVWATGQFAAYAVFGHRRALDAVIVAGLVIIANMALTQNEQLHLMVLFSIAALVLLARTHAFEERITWLRRRIGDPATVTQLYLRGGAAFISSAIVASLLLTATASSAPLQGLWKDVPGALVELSQALQKFLPLGGASRNPGIIAFGENAAILGVWTSSDAVAFRAQLPATEIEEFKWRVASYSDFELISWSWGDEQERFGVAARADLLAGTADDPTDQAARREVRLDITPVAAGANDFALSPQSIRWVSVDSEVVTTGPTDFFAAVDINTSDTYTVTALVPVWGEGPGELTENRLRVASRDYHSEIRRLYLDVPEGAIGTAAQDLLEAIVAQAPAENPYDIAKTMEAYLRSGANFRYDTDVQDQLEEDCQGLSTVECFARIRAGYCQYYASTMAILLRELGIPTRLAQGYLHGQRSGDGLEVVRNSAAHAWVEVYFPGYGWVDFDPTGGNVSEVPARPSGAPETPTPRPSFNIGSDDPNASDPDGPENPRRSPGTTPIGPTTPQPPQPGPFIALGILLLIAVAAVVTIAWRRGPRPMHPDNAWHSLGRWAARFGLAPRPSQTVYEYAGALGDALPIVRPELSTVANAKVEISYGRRELGSDRLKAVAEAHRRLRLGLLRLAFRRRPRLPRGPRNRGRR